MMTSDPSPSPVTAMRGHTLGHSNPLVPEGLREPKKGEAWKGLRLLDGTQYIWATGPGHNPDDAEDESGPHHYDILEKLGLPLGDAARNHVDEYLHGYSYGSADEHWPWHWGHTLSALGETIPARAKSANTVRPLGNSLLSEMYDNPSRNQMMDSAIRLQAGLQQGDPWVPGQYGKGFVDRDGNLHCWVDWQEGDVEGLHHWDYAHRNNLKIDRGTEFYVDPDGGVEFFTARGQQIAEPLMKGMPVHPKPDRNEWNFTAAAGWTVHEPYYPRNDYGGMIPADQTPILVYPRKRQIYKGHPGEIHVDVQEGHGLGSDPYDTRRGSTLALRHVPGYGLEWMQLGKFDQRIHDQVANALGVENGDPGTPGWEFNSVSENSENPPVGKQADLHAPPGASPWTPGQHGKWLVQPDGTKYIWGTGNSGDGRPWHSEVAEPDEEQTPGWIAPDGSVTPGDRSHPFVRQHAQQVADTIKGKVKEYESWDFNARTANLNWIPNAERDSLQGYVGDHSFVYDPRTRNLHMGEFDRHHSDIFDSIGKNWNDADMLTGAIMGNSLQFYEPRWTPENKAHARSLIEPMHQQGEFGHEPLEEVGTQDDWHFGSNEWKVISGLRDEGDSSYGSNHDEEGNPYDHWPVVMFPKERKMYVGVPTTHHQDLYEDFDLPYANKYDPDVHDSGLMYPDHTGKLVWQGNDHPGLRDALSKHVGQPVGKEGGDINWSFSKAAALPAKMYHHSWPENRTSIAAEGLKAFPFGDHPPAVWMATEPFEDSDYGTDVWEVDTRGLNIVDPDKDGEVFTATHDVPKENVRLFETRPEGSHIAAAPQGPPEFVHTQQIPGVDGEYTDWTDHDEHAVIYDPGDHKVYVGKPMIHHDDLVDEFLNGKQGGDRELAYGDIFQHNGENLFMDHFNFNRHPEVKQHIMNHFNAQQKTESDGWDFNARTAAYRLPKGYNPPNLSDPEDDYKGLELKDGQKILWSLYGPNYDRTVHAELMVQMGIKPDQVARYIDSTGREPEIRKPEYQQEFIDFVSSTQIQVEEIHGNASGNDPWGTGIYDTPQRNGSRPFVYDPQRNFLGIGDVNAHHADITKEIRDQLGSPRNWIQGYIKDGVASTFGLGRLPDEVAHTLQERGYATGLSPEEGWKFGSDVRNVPNISAPAEIIEVPKPEGADEFWPYTDGRTYDAYKGRRGFWYYPDENRVYIGSPGTHHEDVIKHGNLPWKQGRFPGVLHTEASHGFGSSDEPGVRFIYGHDREPRLRAVADRLGKHFGVPVLDDGGAWDFNSKTANLDNIDIDSLNKVRQSLSPDDWAMLEANLSDEQRRQLVELTRTQAIPQPRKRSPEEAAWIGACPNCNADAGHVNPFGYLGQDRVCINCGHEWHVPLPEPVLADVPERSPQVKVIESPTTPAQTDPDAHRTTRQPWLYVPDTNHVYLGQPGASHFHIHKDFPYIMDHDLAEEEGAIGHANKDIVGYDENTPDEVYDALNNHLGGGYNSDDNQWNFSHVAALPPTKVYFPPDYDHEEAKRMRTPFWTVQHPETAQRAVVLGHPGSEHAGIDEFHEGRFHNWHELSSGGIKPSGSGWLGPSGAHTYDKDTIEHYNFFHPTEYKEMVPRGEYDDEPYEFLRWMQELHPEDPERMHFENTMQSEQDRQKYHIDDTEDAIQKAFPHMNFGKDQDADAWNFTSSNEVKIVEGTTPAEDSFHRNITDRNPGVFANRRPWLWDKSKNTVYLGQLGTHHLDLINEFNAPNVWGDINMDTGATETILAPPHAVKAVKDHLGFGETPHDVNWNFNSSSA